MNIFYTYKKYKEFKASYENPITALWRAYKREEFISIILKDRDKRVQQVGWVIDYASTIGLFPEKAKKLKGFYDSVRIHDRPDRGKAEVCLEFEYKNHQCKFYGVIENGRTINGDIVGIFFKEEYKFLDLENSTIIDIGANIGDTAIYFCLNNARHVIALEPFPFSYKYLAFNTTTNNMNNKIETLNAGYGKDSEVNVKDIKSNDDSTLEISDSGKKLIFIHLERC